MAPLTNRQPTARLDVSTMPSDLELLRVTLGLFSIIGGTLFGIAALLVEYKDKETGKITTLFRRPSCEKVAPAGQFEAGGRMPVTCPP